MQAWSRRSVLLTLLSIKMLFLKCLILLEIVVSASEMTYIVSGGVLNSTHSLAPLEIVVKTKR